MLNKFRKKRTSEADYQKEESSEDKDPYGEKFIELVETISEVELIIGIVTVSLILIYDQSLWYALGVAAGVFVLESLTLLVISIAENVVHSRMQLEKIHALILHISTIEPSLVPASIMETASGGEDDEDDDKYKILRIAGISIAVTAGIVLVRNFTGL